MNSGADHPHFSKDTGHRRWKRQPGGGSVRSGGAPGMKSGAASLLNRGTLARSFPVYGCLGLTNTPSAGPTSTNCPAYTIPTKSAHSLARPRSCVDKNYNNFLVLLGFFRRVMEFVWVITSKATVGSTGMATFAF